MEEKKCSRTKYLLVGRQQWTQFNKMEERTCSRTNKFPVEKSHQLNMLTDKQVSSWKKAINSIQQNGRNEILTDESSWKKQWIQFNRMEERRCSRRKKILAKKINNDNSIEWEKTNKWSRTNKPLAERKQWSQFMRKEETKCSRKEQASSWQKAMNSIQQDERQNMISENTFQAGRKQRNQFSRKEQRKCSGTNKLLAERK